MQKLNVLLKRTWLLLVIVGSFVFLNCAFSQQEQHGQTSYMKVDSTESFDSLMARMTAAKPGLERDHMALLNERYDLSDRPAAGVTMDRTKPVQEGVRVKLPAGITWEKLASQPDRWRFCLPTLPDRRDQTAGRARPDSVRHRFRFPGSVPA